MSIIPAERAVYFRRDPRQLDWGCLHQFLDQPWLGDDASWKVERACRVAILPFMGRWNPSDYRQVGEELFRAVLANDSDALQFLLQEYPKGRQRQCGTLYDGDGFYLLHNASALGFREVARLLLENGCRVDQVNALGDFWRSWPNESLPLVTHVALCHSITPLHLAARHGHVKMLELLMSYCPAEATRREILHIGAEAAVVPSSTGNLSVALPSALTAAQLAAYEGQWEAAVWLMEYEHGKDDWLRVCAGNKHSALCLGGIPFIEWLLHAGKQVGDLGVRLHRHVSSLCAHQSEWASAWLFRADLTHVEYLLELMADMGQLNAGRVSGLFSKVLPKVLRVSRPHCGDCNPGCTCLMVVKLFHKFGINPRQQVSDVLHQAFHVENLPAAKFLLDEAGWNIHARATRSFMSITAAEYVDCLAPGSAFDQLNVGNCVPLLQLCRIVISRQLSDPRKVDLLPLPRCMKSYLHYETGI